MRCLSLMPLMLLAACAGEPVVLSVSPGLVTVGPAEAVLLSAEVTGAEDTRVTWAAPAGGEVSREGVFRAPWAPGVYPVVATSVADPTVRDTGFVVVQLPPLRLTPDAPSVAPGTEVLLRAHRGADTVEDVTWTVEAGPGVAAIDQGRFVAWTEGVYHVVATASDGSTASCTVAVGWFGEGLQVSPVHVEVSPGGTVAFASSQRGLWVVAEGAAGGAVTSTVSGSASYAAPQTPGTFHVIVTDPLMGLTAVATVVVR